MVVHCTSYCISTAINYMHLQSTKAGKDDKNAQEPKRNRRGLSCSLFSWEDGAGMWGYDDTVQTYLYNPSSHLFYAAVEMENTCTLRGWERLRVKDERSKPWKTNDANNKTNKTKRNKAKQKHKQPQRKRNKQTKQNNSNKTKNKNKTKTKQPPHKTTETSKQANTPMR